MSIDPDDDTYGNPTTCALIKWRHGRCWECEYEENNYDFAYPHDDSCVATSMNVGHRAIFAVLDEREPPVIRCTIDQFCLWDDDGSKNISNPLDGTSMSKCGETVEWIDLRDFGYGTASSTSFEFSETMDDSTAAETFEPHAGILAQLFGITDIPKKVRSCVDNSAIYMKKGRKQTRPGKYTKPSGHDLEMFDKGIAELKLVYANIISKHFVETYKKHSNIHTAYYYPENYVKGLKCADMIAKLVAHSLIEYEARKDCYSISETLTERMQKPCAHVAPKSTAKSK